MQQILLLKIVYKNTQTDYVKNYMFNFCRNAHFVANAYLKVSPYLSVKIRYATQFVATKRQGKNLVYNKSNSIE